MDAALLVDLVHAQLHAVAHLLAEAGQRAGQVLDRVPTVISVLLTPCCFLGLRQGRAAQKAKRGRPGSSVVSWSVSAMCLLVGWSW
jgi:hypothetical protein